VQSDVLRPVAVCHAYEFAESSLCVLKTPATARRLPGCCGQGRCFSSHADRNITAPGWRQGVGVTSPVTTEACGRDNRANSDWTASTRLADVGKSDAAKLLELAGTVSSGPSPMAVPHSHRRVDRRSMSASFANGPSGPRSSAVTAG
jgi:hypothetical protein